MESRFLNANKYAFVVMSAALGAFFLSACQATPTPAAPTEAPQVAATIAPEFFPETEVQPIPLTGELEACNAEISGMAWYGDYLILLPQYPDFFLGVGDGGDGALFAIPKAEIDAYLSGTRTDALEAIQIPFNAGDAEEVAGFEGFEALAFDGETVFLTIEANHLGTMSAYLVKGSIAPDLSSLTLDSALMPQIETQSGVSNISDETLLLTGTEVLTIHEANGAVVNPEPVAHVFDTALNLRGTLPMPRVEYRITDATALDTENKFWAINYFYPGDGKLSPLRDPIVEKFGQGATHAESEGVERLLEFSYSADGIGLTDTPPIVLKLLKNGDLRNWEGIVRYDSGFLLATDKYPCTLLGYVSLNP